MSSISTNNYNNNNPETIPYSRISSISKFSDTIVLNQNYHLKPINHVDLCENLLLTSGDDDLINIIDLNKTIIIQKKYDIINGTQNCFFLRESPSTPYILYFGQKSSKIILYDYDKKYIMHIVQMFPTKLDHFDYNVKSGLLITSQGGNDSIIWNTEDLTVKPCCVLKGVYYAIVNSSEEEIIQCERKKNEKEETNSSNCSVISLRKYRTKNSANNNKKGRGFGYSNSGRKNFNYSDDNFSLNSFAIDKNSKKEIKKENIDYEILQINNYKNFDISYIIIMGKFIIDLLTENKNNEIRLSLKDELVSFTYIEPVFTKEIIVGFSNGRVEVFDPINNKEKSQEKIMKMNEVDKVKDFLEIFDNNKARHIKPVKKIKISEYFPMFVSISEDAIIHQISLNELSK